MFAWSMRAISFIVFLVTMTMLFAASGEAAQPAPTDAAGLSDTQIDRRIQFLEQRLDDSRTHGQIWFWSWLTIDSGSMIGNGVIAGMRDQHDDRVHYAVNSALGAIGIADLFLRPLEARYGAAPIRGLPEATRAEKLAKLRTAEDQLRRNAERAEQRWEVLPYVGNAGLALTAGLVDALWGEPGRGLQTGVATMIGGTINLWTQPWRPEQDWKDYLAMTGRRTAQLDVDLVMTALEDGGKLNLRLRW